MPARLIIYVLGVALLQVACLSAIASQSERFVGLNEVPPFVCDRVELIAGLGLGFPRGDVAPGDAILGAPHEAQVAGSGAICTSAAGHRG